MIVEIPFAYEATVIPRGCRNEKTAQAWGAVAVRIQEIEGEAVSAAILRTPSKTVKYVDVGDGLAVAKTRAIIVDGKRVRRVLKAEKMQEWLNAARVAMGHGRFDEKMWGEPEFEVAGPADVRRWVSDKSDRQKSAVRAAASKLVVVDGVVFERTTGPVWDIHNALNNVRSLVAVASQEGAEAPYWMTWRGDRMAEALEATQVLNNGTPPEVIGEIEVLRPEAFTWDDDWANLMQAVETFISDSGRSIHEWPTSSITRWAWLRDQLVAWPLRRDPETFSAVVAMRRAVDRGLLLRNDCYGNPQDHSGLDACIRRVLASGVPAADATPPEAGLGARP